MAKKEVSLTLPDARILKDEEFRVILMKSGMPIWIRKKESDQLQPHLAGLSAHGFVRLERLDQTVNTANVDGVYTPQQYVVLTRIKKGEWICEYRRFHSKNQECECAARIRAERQQQERLDEERQEQEEERAHFEKYPKGCKKKGTGEAKRTNRCYICYPWSFKESMEYQKLKSKGTKV